jgi:hypothetical protein
VVAMEPGFRLLARVEETTRGERIGPTKSATPYLCRGVSSNIATIHHGHLRACTLHLFLSKFSCDAVKVKGVLLFNYWRY